MARKIKEAEEVPGLLDIEPDEIEKALAGLGDEETSVRLFRVNPQGKPAYICEFDTVTDFSLEAIKNTYGGGKFKIVAGGRTFRVEIEGEPKAGSRAHNKPVLKRYDERGRLVFTNSGEPGETVVIDSEVKPNGQPSNDPLLLLILQELRAMKEAPKGKDDRKGFLEELLMYKNLFSSEKPASAGEEFTKSAIELLKQGIELGANADSGGVPSWVTLIEKVLPTVNNAINAVTLQARQRQGNMGPVQPAQPPMNPELPKPEENLTGFDAIAPRLRPFLPAFLTAASSNVDPRNLIDVTLPSLPEENLPVIIEWLQSPSWLDDLVKLHPAIGAQAAWWRDYRNGLLLALTNPEQYQVQE